MHSSHLKRAFGAAGLTLLLGASGVHAQDANGFYLKDGDRVVFYGDSITEQRLYTTFTEDYVLTRFPKWKLTFVHSGWGGDRVTGGGGGPIDRRLQRDVLAYNPTVMTIMLGMNDGSYRAFDQGIYDTYSKGYAHILDFVKQADPGVRFTLIEPSAYDDITVAPSFDGGYNGVLMRYSQYVKDLAQQNNDTVADFNAPLVALLQKAKDTDAGGAGKIIPGRVHPSPAGHLIMAEQLLKAWNAPSLVAKVQIDAAAKNVVSAQNTQVSNLNVGDTVTWTQTDDALPFPLNPNDQIIALVLKSSDFLDAVDQEPLQVTGLTAPQYNLKIDGVSMGNFASADLAQGVNLATLPTPMLKQAQAVAGLTIQHNNLHYQRWRSIQVPMQDDQTPAVRTAVQSLTDALDGEEATVVAQQQAAAQPVAHHFELTTQLDVPPPPPASAGLLPLPANAGPNLAFQKPVVSSAQNTYGWDGGLNDGSYVGAAGTCYATDDSTNFPKTATIDLGQTAPLALVTAAVPNFGSTKTITVSVSADGKTFTDVGTYVFKTNQAEEHQYVFPPTPARYVRLTYPDHYDDVVGYPNTFVFTSEVEAYAPGATK